jgi:ribosomal protein S18 acetylase RimI-like enzyme
MLRVRTVTDAADFAGAPGDPHDYTDQIADLYASGESRPEWCFVVEDGRDRLGRVGFRVSPTTSDVAWLGTLPENELSAFGLHLPWKGEFEKPAGALFTAAASDLIRTVPDLLEIRINNEVHAHTTERCQMLVKLGFGLFIEKQGFSWTSDGTHIEVPERLTYKNIAEVGIDAYQRVMSQCGEESLDRNDRYYWEGTGPENWARQMTHYAADSDATMWLVAYADDEPVGYIAVASDEDWGSTIVHVGVVPGQRGNGYVDDLISAGSAAAQSAGITSMLSDVDVVNVPMIEAMRRAGHIEDARPWHVWVYRTDLASLASTP